MSTESHLASRANPRFKELRQRLSERGGRRQSTLLLGEKLIEAWRAAPHAARFEPEGLLSLEGTRRHPLAHALGLETLWLSETLLRDLADASTPPTHALWGRLGPEPEGPLASRVMVPWEIQDPGNLGAVLRSAAAFGFEEALLGPGCADPFSPKALRGTMGAAFLLKVRRVTALSQDAGRWWALDGGSDATPLEQADLSEPLRLLVGNEGHGWRHVELPPWVERLAIPIQGVESLNAAVAAGIACHEAARRKSL